MSEPACEEERLRQALAEAEFKVWYYSARLDAWASLAQTLEHLLHSESLSITGSTKAMLLNAQEKFRAACAAVNERLKSHMAERQASAAREAGQG